MDRLLASRIVQQAGHTPFFAGDGEAAVQMYVENDIQLVITDLRMPKLDGLSLIRRILTHDPEARIIAVSGLAQHLDAAEAAGAVAGLVKPVRPQDLIAYGRRCPRGGAITTTAAARTTNGRGPFWELAQA